MTNQTLTTGQIFELLAAPFDETEVRSRRGQGGRELRYITARTARRRLNDVLGFDGWECKVRPSDDGVVCSLTIHLPDGRSLTREAMGGYRQTSEQQDRSKSGDSDAFKRVCVLFRVGEYLYGDDDEHARPAQAQAQRRPDARAQNGPARNGSAQPDGKWGNAYRGPARDQEGPNPEPRAGGEPRSGKAMWAWLHDHQEKHPDGAGLVDHVVEWAIGEGFPDRCFRWNFDQIRLAQAEAVRYLGGTGKAYESAARR